MATASDPRKGLEELLTCALCLNIYTKPITLPCFHSFCEACLKDLLEQQKNGLACPMCRQFADIQSCKANFMVNECLELYKSSTSMCVCHLCDTESSEWSCMDCKIHVCSRCQKIHLRTPSCRGHRVIARDENIDWAIDSLIFCDKHKDQTIQLNCTSCSLPICFMCKATDHDKHSTETIDDALTKIVPVFKQHLLNIETQVRDYENQNLNLQEQIADTKQIYEAAHKQLDEDLNARIERLKENYRKENQQLEQMQKEQVEKLEKAVKENENEIAKMGNVVNFSKSALERAKHVNLLKELKGGLYEKVAQMTNIIMVNKGQDIKIPYVIDVKTRGLTNPVSYQANFERTLLWGECIAKPFEEIWSSVKKQKPSEKMIQTSRYMLLVADMIWSYDNDNYIDVFNRNLEEKGSIDVQKLGCINKLDQIDAATIVAATDHGLYLLDLYGRVKEKLLNSLCSDVSAYKGMFAAFENESKRIIVFANNEKQNWEKIHEFSVKCPNYPMLILKEDLVYIYRTAPQKVQVYKHMGTLIKEYNFVSQKWIEISKEKQHESLQDSHIETKPTTSDENRGLVISKISVTETSFDEADEANSEIPKSADENGAVKSEDDDMEIDIVEFEHDIDDVVYDSDESDDAEYDISEAVYDVIYIDINDTLVLIDTDHKRITLLYPDSHTITKHFPSCQEKVDNLFICDDRLIMSWKDANTHIHYTSEYKIV